MGWEVLGYAQLLKCRTLSTTREKLFISETDQIMCNSGRTDCNFDTTKGGVFPWCSTGGCNGGLECAVVGGTFLSYSEITRMFSYSVTCDSVAGTGIPPATLAEFNLGVGASGTDWMDISGWFHFMPPASV